MGDRKPQSKALRLSGTVASGGLISGDVVCLGVPKAAARPVAATSPEAEKTSLDEAVAAAGQDLESLLAGLDDEEAAGIIEFQVAMLEDETVLEPAYASIQSGAAALAAWESAMAVLIDDYRNAEDDYFKARVSDLADMNDRVIRHLEGVADNPIPPGSVVIGEDLAPTLFLETDWTGSGIVLHGGSTNSHVAMLARARGIPMLVAVERQPHPDEGSAWIDGENGCVIFHPDEESAREFEQRHAAAEARTAVERHFLNKPAITADGVAIDVRLNIAQPGELDVLDPAHCDGIGLVRTEFLFHGEGLPDEDRQLACYARIVDWADGRPVVIRTLDAGGDKPIPGLTEDGESNPFLGVRGFRLSRRHPEVIKTQLRALLRCATRGPVKIMLPMISVPEEMIAARRLLDEARAELDDRGESYGDAPLGMMVEVPAAALCIELFEAEFYSIGSNDLVQYIMACGRDNPNLGDLKDGHVCALAKLIRSVTDHAQASGREASLCGDMAADPGSIAMLLQGGLRCLSVSPAALAGTKAAIARQGSGSDA